MKDETRLNEQDTKTDKPAVNHDANHEWLLSQQERVRGLLESEVMYGRLYE